MPVAKKVVYMYADNRIKLKYMKGQNMYLNLL